MRKHGGTLEGRNCPDGGACFEMWLPARPGAQRGTASGAGCPVASSFGDEPVGAPAEAS